MTDLALVAIFKRLRNTLHSGVGTHCTCGQQDRLNAIDEIEEVVTELEAALADPQRLDAAVPVLQANERLRQQLAEADAALAASRQEADALRTDVNNAVGASWALEAQRDQAEVTLRALRDQPTGIVQIAAERQRQMDTEGWTAVHDDTHVGSELTSAACCYAALARRQADGTITGDVDELPPASGWPWDAEWWKPSNDPKRNLEKAGALIAAEIDRLLRAALTPPTPPQGEHDDDEKTLARVDTTDS